MPGFMAWEPPAQPDHLLPCGVFVHPPRPRAADPTLPADKADEGWCRKHAVSGEALRLAGIVRAELLEVMQRIELPVSPPAFGTDTNVLNIQRALISGYFLKVCRGAREGLGCGAGGRASQPCSPPAPLPRWHGTSTAPATT